MALPAIRLSLDGVTYSPAGERLAFSASATVHAKLDSIANVGTVEWSIEGTDSLGAAVLSATITQTGIVGEYATFTCGAVGTAFILKAVVNNGVDSATNNVDLEKTTARVKGGVLTAGGLWVGVFNEGLVSGPRGWEPDYNAAVRGSTAGGPATPTSRLISTTFPLSGGGDLSANRTLSIVPATAISDGSLSAADKTKLDGIEAGAQAVTTAHVLAALAGQDASLASLWLTSGAAVVQKTITGAGTTTTGGTLTLASYTVPAGSVAEITYHVIGLIEPASAAADSSKVIPGLWRRRAIFTRASAAAAYAASDDITADGSDVTAPLLDPNAYGGAYQLGGPKLDLTGNVVSIQVQGLAGTAAFQTGGHAYAAAGELVTSGGKVYEVITPGTGDSTTGPTASIGTEANGPDTLVFRWISDTPAEWSVVTIHWSAVVVVRL